MAHRPGCHGGLSPAVIRSSTRAASPTSRAACTASAQLACSPLPHQPRGSRSPASTTPTCTGWAGSAAKIWAISASEGRLSTPGSGSGSCSRCGSTTWPTVYSARSTAPRDRLRTSVSSRPGSNVVASSARSASSGLRTGTVWRRGSSAGSPNASHVGRPDERERQHLDVARLGQGDRHGAAAPLRRGEPASGGRGGQLGRDRRRSPPAAAPPRRGRRAAARSGRHDGGVATTWPRPSAPAPARRAQPTWPRRRGRGAGRVRHARHPVGQVQRHPHRARPRGRRRRRCARPRSCRRRARRAARATRSAATGGSCGSTVRSNRRDASLGSLCRRAPRAIVAGSKCAASITTSIGSVPGRISVDAPPITPARPIGPESSVMSRSSGSRRRSTSSRVVSVSPGCARRTTMRPGQPRRVVGVQRLAQLEHHVVGDVDDQRDRAHPGPEQPPLHPPRRRRRRVDPVDAAGDEAQAAVVGQRDRPRRHPRRPARPTRLAGST